MRLRSAGGQVITCALFTKKRRIIIITSGTTSISCRELLTIPVSGTVKIGLLKAAIKMAGLTEEEFAQWL